jgi:hypothetical protein
MLFARTTGGETSQRTEVSVQPVQTREAPAGVQCDSAFCGVQYPRPGDRT